MESGSQACFLEPAPARIARLLSRLNSTSTLRSAWNGRKRPALRASHWPISVCGLRGVAHLDFFGELERQLLDPPPSASSSDALHQLSNWVNMAILMGLSDADLTMAERSQEFLCDTQASKPKWAQHFHRRLSAYLAALASSLSACLDAQPHNCYAPRILGDIHNLNVESFHRIAASEVAHLKTTNVSFALLLDGIWDDPWPYFPGMNKSQDGDYCQDRLVSVAMMYNAGSSPMQASQPERVPRLAHTTAETLHQYHYLEHSFLQLAGAQEKDEPPLMMQDILNVSRGNLLASPAMTVVFSDGSDDHLSESCSLDSFLTSPLAHSPLSSPLSPLFSEISDRLKDLPFGHSVLAV